VPIAFRQAAYPVDILLSPILQASEGFWPRFDGENGPGAAEETPVLTPKLSDLLVQPVSRQGLASCTDHCRRAHNQGQRLETHRIAKLSRPPGACDLSVPALRPADSRLVG